MCKMLRYSGVTDEILSDKLTVLMGTFKLELETGDPEILTLTH